MKIQSVGVVNQSAPNVFANKNLNNSQTKKPTFGINLEAAISTTWKSADEISSSLSKNYGMSTEFRGNDLVANMVERTVNIFKSIFPTSYLPRVVKFKPLDKENLLGCFCLYGTVYINANKDRFYNRALLQKESKNEGFRYPLCKSFYPSKSELQIFVHEFAHCAHCENILKNGNDSSWYELDSIPVPDFYERVLNLKKIGKYATQDNKNVEVIATSLTRQILEYPESLLYNDKSTLFNFPDIPSTNAQKFLRAVWDGEIEEAKRLRYDVGDESWDKRSDDQYEFLTTSLAGLTGLL